MVRASPVQQLVFEPPTSDDYYTSDTSPLEFQLDDLLGHTADEIGGTQLTGAPPVTQPTQEQKRTMMEDFHDLARRVGEALAVAASVEVEAQATREGPVPSCSATPEEAAGGGRLVKLGYSTGSNRRGAVPLGSSAPLATPSPEPAVGGRETPSL
jgi:hypothetical protein